MYQVRDTLLETVSTMCDADLQRITQRLLNSIQGSLCDDHCWLSNYKPNGRGYINIYDRSTNRTGHRILWSVYYKQPIPKGLLIRHTCHNKNCLNPTHLQLGNDKLNSEDNRDRLRNGNYTGVKLNEQSVLAIRQRINANEALASIACDFGVSRSTISAIKFNRSWSWLS